MLYRDYIENRLNGDYIGIVFPYSLLSTTKNSGADGKGCSNPNANRMQPSWRLQV